MPPQLTLKNITKAYKTKGSQVRALSSINISVSKEEFACIIGPNGSGKSTLLKIIAGIEEATSGTLTKNTETSYLPQQPSLLPWRTVEDNLLLTSDVQKTSTKLAKNKIRTLLKDFGLLEFAAFYPRMLSGGMQQKVALLRTVLFNPSFLLLDEPFASLDAITRLELQSWLLDLRKKMRFSALCVTHDIREAVNLADTIYVLGKRPGYIKEKFSVTSSHSQQNALEKKLYALLVDKP